ncbi:hypothetical protein GSQ51_21130, partial [Clostridioides difficile]|nr:hypothetical protein [Clostridioides difficile]
SATFTKFANVVSLSATLVAITYSLSKFEFISSTISSIVPLTLKTLFGDDMSYSAYKLGKLALLGNVKELLLYRLVDGNQKKGT